MVRTGWQVGVTGMLLVVACAAVNLWLFRWSVVAGLVGLNLTKHVAVAVVCRNVGVNQGPDRDGDRAGGVGSG